MIKYIAVGGAAVAGAALLEAALVPALAIGGAMLLAPAVLPRLRRWVEPAIGAVTTPLVQSAPAPSEELSDAVPPTLIARLGIKQALAKTVTYRVIVTSLDFTTNFIVLGELTTAAGLSTINIVGGPIFYFVHETVWNHLRPARDDVVDVLALGTASSDGEGTNTEEHGGWSISRPLAKTITFRTFATVMDFTTNYVVVGDVVTAVGLSAAGFVLGPFVYWGHEKVWDHFSAPRDRGVEPPRANLAGDYAGWKNVGRE
jgi:uncharacterized membrane protein